MPDTLGDRVRKHRVAEGLTQRELGSRAGISTTFVSDVENDKRNVSSRVLQQLGDALGVSLDYLMTGDDREYDPPSQPVEIPRELEKAATGEGWTYTDTVSLLKAKQMVARRLDDVRGPDELGYMDWIELYRALFPNG